MYHVVTAVDDDREQAAELAETVGRLAEEADLKVTLVHVFRNADVSQRVAIYRIADDYEEQLEEGRDVPVAVRETLDRLAGAEFDLEFRIESGDPAEEILRVADEADADAVHVGGRKRSPVGKALVGSVAQDVIFSTSLPVLIG
ncbi:MAG: universal stress protein [Salinigranum sp.]